MHQDVLIIGAGPTGLITAYELAKKGIRSAILEARDRIGGRAFTHSKDIELGAEFVHGELPLTLGLLKEAKLLYTATGGEWIQLRSGRGSEAFGADEWPQFMRKLGALEEDISLQDFLERYFPDSKYAALKDQAIGYAEGYDTADASRASCKALYAEWSEHESDQYRIDDGYKALMDYLAEAALDAGSRILLSHPATAMEVFEGGVRVQSGDIIFTASRVVIALPLGVLQHSSAMSFNLQPEYNKALQTLGFGDVIKFVLRFHEPFWEASYPGLGFLLASEEVPTWWTQAPAQNSVLTGWMAGRAAKRHAALSDTDLLRLATGSLAKIFSIEQDNIEALITESHVANWSADRYARGSYAYATVGGEAARATLEKPMQARVFFAGEYMYDGPAMGTVEAAFRSGVEVAQQIAEQGK